MHDAGAHHGPDGCAERLNALPDDGTHRCAFEVPDSVTECAPDISPIRATKRRAVENALRNAERFAN